MAERLNASESPRELNVKNAEKIPLVNISPSDVFE